MVTRRLYSDSDLIAELVEKLKEVEVLDEVPDEKWFTKYIDPGTGEYWLMYKILIAYDGNSNINLLRLPQPDVNELIRIIITSQFEDEAVAAVNLLSYNEKIDNREFRDNLIGELEKLRPESLTFEEKEKFKKVIKFGLNCSLNRRSIMNKSYQEVLSDAAFFQSMADKATRVLKELNNH